MSIALVWQLKNKAHKLFKTFPSSFKKLQIPTIYSIDWWELHRKFDTSQSQHVFIKYIVWYSPGDSMRTQ